jgi:PAS domain S-box-containing protein
MRSFEISQHFNVCERRISTNGNWEQNEHISHLPLKETFHFVGVLTTEGIWVECNREALIANGLTYDEVIGKSFCETFWWSITPKTQQDLRAAIAQAAKGEIVRYNVEIYESKNSKKIIATDFRLLPVRDEKGQVIFILSEGKSFSELEEAKERRFPDESGIPSDKHIASEPANAATGTDAARPATQKKLIMVADDDAEMRDYISHLLHNEYRVYGVRNGLQAVEATKRLRPALVLADVMMPVLNGFGTLRAIRNDPSLSSIPVILLSAGTGDELRVDVLQAGADDYLVKPFTASELMTCVSYHINMDKLLPKVAKREVPLRAKMELESHQLQELLDIAPAAIGFMSGPEHRWTYVNEHLVRISGRNSPIDFVGRTVVESLPELQAQGPVEFLDMVYGTGKSHIGREMKVSLNRKATGQLEDAYFDFVYQPVRNAEGAVEGILVHAVEVTDKVSARKAIEENAERSYLANTAAQIGTWEWNPINNSMILSAEIHRLWGTYPSDPNFLETWQSRVHPEDLPRVEKLLNEAQPLEHLEFEHRYLHPELGVRWFYCKGSRLQARATMLGIVQDITARKAAEEARRDSEERFRAIVETTPDCVKLVSRDGTLLHMNSAGLSMIGAKSRDFVVGKSVYEVVAPEDHDRFREFNERIFQGEKGSLEYDIIGVGGIRRHMETHAAPLRNADGPIVHLGVTRDISERKQVQDALQRLSAIVSSSDDAIMSEDLNGTVTSWNSAAEKLFGYTAEEMIGQPFTKIMPPELWSDVTIILQTIARGETIAHFETVRMTKSGERIEVSLTISPMKDASGRVVGEAVISRDITERKKAERALHTAEKLASVGRLAATVAHEINNPLEALTNLIYLARNSSSKDEIQTLLASAEEELDRVSHLAKQTLGFYRETKGTCMIQVGSMVTALLSVFSSRMRNKRIEIHSEIDVDPEIWAVPGEIRQLLANLISNSIDAVPVGGKIRIRVSAAKEWNGNQRTGARLTVADNGSGILEEIQSQIFEPFVTTKKEVGTGLGLWVCKSIVEKHHGTIRMRSSTIDGKSWTAFSVFLPFDVKQMLSDKVAAGAETEFNISRHSGTWSST